MFQGTCLNKNCSTSGVDDVNTQRIISVIGSGASLICLMVVIILLLAHRLLVVHDLSIS